MRFVAGIATALVFVFLTWIVVADVMSLKLNKATDGVDIAIR